MDGFIVYGGVMASKSNHLTDWVGKRSCHCSKTGHNKLEASWEKEQLLKLHNSNASVLAVISDGAGNNRSIWSQLGVSGKNECHMPLCPSSPRTVPKYLLHLWCSTPCEVHIKSPEETRLQNGKGKMCECSEQFDNCILLLPGWWASHQLPALCNSCKVMKNETDICWAPAYFITAKLLDNSFK